MRVGNLRGNNVTFSEFFSSVFNFRELLAHGHEYLNHCIFEHYSVKKDLEMCTLWYARARCKLNQLPERPHTKLKHITLNPYSALDVLIYIYFNHSESIFY